MAASGAGIRVEVACALPGRQQLLRITVAAGTTVAEAIAASGIAASFADLELRHQPVGIWGRLVEPGQVLEDGDRVEIYRPLQLDPREARRRLAADGKAMGQRLPRRRD